MDFIEEAAEDPRRECHSRIEGCFQVFQRLAAVVGHLLLLLLLPSHGGQSIPPLNAGQLMHHSNENRPPQQSPPPLGRIRVELAHELKGSVDLIVNNGSGKKDIVDSKAAEPNECHDLPPIAQSHKESEDSHNDGDANECKKGGPFCENERPAGNGSQKDMSRPRVADEGCRNGHGRCESINEHWNGKERAHEAQRGLAFAVLQSHGGDQVHEEKEEDQKAKDEEHAGK